MGWDGRNWHFLTKLRKKITVHLTLSSIFSVSDIDNVKSEATIVFRGKFYVFYQVGVA